mgnify:CR=1 FL=1
MKKLETIDQNFIKTLLDNLPQNIEELSVPKDKNNKKTLELISLAAVSYTHLTLPTNA